MPGPERRGGFSSFDVKSCHFDGGYEAEGIASIHGSFVGSIDELELLGAAYDTLQGDLEELGVESVEDLRELDEEDIEALAAKLKKVQAKKFTKKIAALRA